MAVVRTLLSASALIAVGMLAGRLLGLLREILLASQFGTGAVADVAILLLIIPDFITAALIGGAASAALLPAFAARDESRQRQLFWQALWLSVAMAVFMVVLFWGVQAQFSLLGSVDDATVPHAPWALFLALCSLPLSAATAIITTRLQHYNRLLAPAFANAVFNLVVIAALIMMPSSALVVACAIIGASAARLATHWWALSNMGMATPVFSWKPFEFDARLGRAYMATTGSGIMNMLPQYVPYAVIGAAGAGLAMFNYAFKLVLLPAMLFQTIIQMVLFPWIISVLKNEGREMFAKRCLCVLQMAGGIAVVMSLSLSLASHALVTLCFGYGAMSAESIRQVTVLFAIGIWALPCMLMAGLWQQVLYALEDTKTPLISSFTQAVLVIPLCGIGNSMIGVPGVVVAFVAVQLVPLMLFAKRGVEIGLIASLRPSRDYAWMFLAIAATFFPLAWFADISSVTPLAAIALSFLIGLLSLLAGMAACPPIRIWGKQCFK